MTTSEIKGKSAPEILGEKKALAAKGSCKTCQFCLKGEPGDWWQEHYCAIQGNVNPLTFTQEALLDSESYPYGPCDDGNWSHTEDDGSKVQINGCLAYMPRTVEGVSYGDAVVSRQWAFMHCLSQAAKLHYDIEDAHSGKAQAKLDELLRHLNTGDFSDYSLI